MIREASFLLKGYCELSSTETVYSSCILKRDKYCLQIHGCKRKTFNLYSVVSFMFPCGSLVLIGFILCVNPMSLAHNVVSMFTDMFSCSLVI